MMIFGELVDTLEETKIQKLFDELSLPEVNHVTYNESKTPSVIIPIDDIISKY
jgi:hypothetical protein